MSCSQARAISRRGFFGGGAASLALWSLMPRTAIAGTRDPRLLIVVLRGGFDGLRGGAGGRPRLCPPESRHRPADDRRGRGAPARWLLCPQRGNAGAACALPETRSADPPRRALPLPRPVAFRRPGRARERARRDGAHRGRLAQPRASAVAGGGQGQPPRAGDRRRGAAADARQGAGTLLDPQGQQPAAARFDDRAPHGSVRRDRSSPGQGVRRGHGD